MHNDNIDFISTLTREAILLLQELIKTPSFSKEEDKTALLIENYLLKHNVIVKRVENNIYAYNKFFDKSRPSILLNSHHDTVKPNSQYTRDPFNPIIEDGKLYGLGSNDAGASVVSLISLFLYFYNQEGLKYNLILVISAEEENSGRNGIELVLPLLKGDNIEFAIVGEPTLMDLAISERGLVVLDCTAEGKVGHAAREEGINAIDIAIKDICWLKKYEFERVSPLDGKIKCTTTIINAGTVHNVVPPTCSFTIDIRTTSLYTNREVVDIISKNFQSKVVARSLRMNPSSIASSHPFVMAGVSFNRKTYSSPTSSDQALIPYTSVKIGVGDSARSHSADEFVFIKEIEDGIPLYINMLKSLI